MQEQENQRQQDGTANRDESDKVTPFGNEEVPSPAASIKSLVKCTNGVPLSPVCEDGIVRVRCSSSTSCSTLGADAAVFDFEEEISDARLPPARPRTLSAMSNVTKKYDLTGKGYLDDAERAMRALDTDNAGTLDMHKVYHMMKEMQEQQKELHEQQKNFSNLKKVVIVLACFSMILALANLGTAFAAATLAKDTKVDSSSGALLAKGSGEMISTVSTGSVVHVLEYNQMGNIYDRHLRVSRRAIVMGRLGGEPEAITCPDPPVGEVIPKEVKELLRNIERGVSSLSIKFVSNFGDAGVTIKTDISLHIEESNYDETEDKLHIRASRTFACTEGDEMCLQYRIAPEDYRFEPLGEGKNYGLFNCVSGPPIPMAEKSLGLGDGGL